jgi:hypothetical protein
MITRGLSVCVFLIAACACPPGAQPARADGAEQSQFDRLLADRPLIADALTERPLVRDWIIQRFAETHPPLAWDASAPVSGRNGEFDAREPGLVRIRIAARGSGIDQLSTLIFEPHNVMGYAAFEDIHNRAVAGDLSRDDYARAMLEQEFVALTATRDFLATNMPTLSAPEQRAAQRYDRYLRGPESLDGRLAEARAQGVDLLDHYRVLYDTIVVAEQRQH